MKEKRLELIMLCITLLVFILLPMMIGNIQIINYIGSERGNGTLMAILLIMEIGALFFSYGLWKEIWEEDNDFRYVSKYNTYKRVESEQKPVIKEPELTVEEKNKIFTNEPFKADNIQVEDS